MARGYLATKPARGVRMNPRPKLTRFLSSDEIRRLHQTLERCVAERPSYGQQADIIRLLLLTGCRKGELLNLQWREVNGDVLDLIDGKTGPRRVFLNARAKAIIERQPRSGSAFVFPSPLNPLRPRSGEIGLWRLARKRAGLEGVRLHDLRHSFASHAVMNGVPPAGGGAPARAQTGAHDAALRPCRGARGRGGGGTHRADHHRAHGHLSRLGRAQLGGASTPPARANDAGQPSNQLIGRYDDGASFLTIRQRRQTGASMTQTRSALRGPRPSRYQGCRLWRVSG